MIEPQPIAGRYLLRERIGSGGMATVYLAVDQRLGRTVAVKLLYPHLAADPVFVERFEREAQAAAVVNHPNVVAIYDFGVDDGGGVGEGADPATPSLPRLAPLARPFIVMEYVPGADLNEVLRRRGPLPEAEALAIAAQVAGALEAAHQRGVIHRDVKPHNVLLDPGGRAKVTDFGIARAAAYAHLTQTATIVGTAHYLAPEQARYRLLDGQSDLYSLGVVLYELVTGRVPFSGDSPVAVAWQHVHDPPVPPRHVRPGISSACEAVILSALAKDPAGRYQTATEMRRALELAGEARVYPATVATPQLAAGGPDQAETAAEDATILLGMPPRPAYAARHAAPPARTGFRTGVRLAALLAVVSLSLLAGAAALIRSAGMSVTAGEAPPAAEESGPLAPATPGAPAASPPAEVGGVRAPAPPPAAEIGGPLAPATATPVATAASPAAGAAPATGPAPVAAAPTETPRPPAAPTAAPARTTAPVPTVPPPAARAPPAPPAAEALPVAAPTEAVAAFYRLVAQRQFDAAANLWTARMRVAFPPVENIHSRFGATQRLMLQRAEVVAQDDVAGRATVAIELVEVVGPQGAPAITRRYVGTWQLVRGPAGWLLDQPNLRLG